MKRITTAAALRALADKILKTTKNDADDEAYSVDLDKILNEVESGNSN